MERQVLRNQAGQADFRGRGRRNRRSNRLCVLLLAAWATGAADGLVGQECKMRITYDPEVDAPYIRFIETTVTTQHVAEGVAVDYAEDGRIAGIEILDARERLGDRKVFSRIVLEQVGFPG
jgi:uncharacterized protein YuzE